MSIPTFMLFEDGNKIKEIIGAVSKQELINFFDLKK
jgi:thioredoxin-like negative regulator of GroEL